MPNCLAVTAKLAPFVMRQAMTSTGSALRGRPRLVLPRCVKPVAVSDFLARSRPAWVRSRMASLSISAISANTATISRPALELIEPSPRTTISTPLSLSARTIAWISMALRPSRSMALTCSLSPSRMYPSIAPKPGRLPASTEPLTPSSTNSLSKDWIIDPSNALRCASIV